ncbi:MAG: hypothetical protein JXM70_07720 [Pirellulales bacterium]|nr:hypothetical protein [Pirellulales bacterium]
MRFFRTREIGGREIVTIELVVDGVDARRASTEDETIDELAEVRHRKFL